MVQRRIYASIITPMVVPQKARSGTDLGTESAKYAEDCQNAHDCTSATLSTRTRLRRSHTIKHRAILLTVYPSKYAVRYLVHVSRFPPSFQKSKARM